MRNRTFETTFETQFCMGYSFLNILLSDQKPRNGNLDWVSLASLPELQKHYKFMIFCPDQSLPKLERGSGITNEGI